MLNKFLFRLLPAAGLLSALTSGCTSYHPSSTGLLMLVGTYTDAGSEGIYSFRFHAEDASWQPLDSIALPNPSFLAVDSLHHLVYAVSENGNETDAVSALRIDPSNGKMQLLGSHPTLGAAPCYVAVKNNLVVTANYTGGSLSLFPLQDDGTLLPVDTLFQGSTGGDDLERQATPHMHCAHFSPDGRFLFVSDFSSDRLLRYSVSPTQPLLHSPQVAVQLSPGNGPRHLTFSADGRHAYLINELSGLIHCFSYTDGQLALLQTIEADSVHARGSAHIQLSPDGRHLYASNRLQQDGIAIFSVGADGTLAPAGYQLTGKHPRHFNITPDGRYLLVACRDSQCIEIYRRDASTGSLSSTGKAIPLSKPVAIVWHTGSR